MTENGPTKKMRDEIIEKWSKLGLLEGLEGISDTVPEMFFCNTVQVIPYSVIIAGGRDFTDYEELVRYCDYILKNKPSVEIVSGVARGADLLGEKYALERGFPIRRFPADWDSFGNSAGYRRNIDMAKYADALIAFWDGKSKGTKHMIDTAKKNNLNVRVKQY